jgi:hypothetical protein
VHVVINGREWLSRDLRKQGLDYEQRGNCFVDLADVSRSQRLMDRQLKINWSRLLDCLLRKVHPSHRRLFPDPLHYYWSAGELTSHLATRPEGIRIKHARDRNSIKMYDKQESILRIETTINSLRQMKSYRAAEDDPHGPKSWRGLRKGVADLHRRAQISQKSNKRYLDDLASVEAEPSLAQSTARLCRRTTLASRIATATRRPGRVAGDDTEVIRKAFHRPHGNPRRRRQSPASNRSGVGIITPSAEVKPALTNGKTDL